MSKKRVKDEKRVEMHQVLKNIKRRHKYGEVSVPHRGRWEVSNKV